MRFSLPALAVGAVTTLIITAILVFLRDVEIIHWLTIMIGGALLGCVLAFISVWMIHAPNYSVAPTFTVRPSFWEMWASGPSARRRQNRILLPQWILTVTILVVATFLGGGRLYGIPVFGENTPNGFGEWILATLVVFFLPTMFAFMFISVAFTEAEIRTQYYSRFRVIVIYVWAFGIMLSIVFWMVFFALLADAPQQITTSVSLFFAAFILARPIFGFALIRTSREKANEVRDFFIPLFVVLIPLTAYLSGITYVS